MKAILIIDMPIDCLYCPCYRQTEYMEDCKAMARPLTVGERDNKPSWCPLKPMPSREDIHEEIYQAYGLGKEEPYVRMRDAVDKVLDEMLGEEE